MMFMTAAVDNKLTCD